MKQKRQLTAKVLGTSPSKIRFDPTSLSEVSKAITRSDIRGLLAVGTIRYVPGNSQSRARARHLLLQKRKGRRKGHGTRKGSSQATVSRKGQWVTAIRAQRSFLRRLKERGLVSPTDYHALYTKSKGGLFRNVRHIKLYLSEHQLIQSLPPKKEESLPVKEHTRHRE